VTRVYKMSYATAALLIAHLAVTAAQAQRIQVVPNEVGRRVDVIVDGKPFTSYIWPTTLKKPTLFPVRSANGTVVTRGYPLEPRKGERVDHPHHVGIWLNHGNVNGGVPWGGIEARFGPAGSPFACIACRNAVARSLPGEVSAGPARCTICRCPSAAR